MTRAAISGAIDFAKFDPFDLWAWRRLDWVLDELGQQANKDVCQLQHNHWATLASHGRLTPESFDQVKTNASAAMNAYMIATYPWRKEEFGEVGLENERERAVSSYHERFGKPGEARYELMVDELHKYFAKGKLDKWEKARLRKARREKREARRKAAMDRRLKDRE